MGYDQQMTLVQDAVLQSMSDGLIVTDFTGTFRYVNRMIEKILGIDRSMIIGQTIAKLFAEHPGNDEFMEAILDTGDRQGSCLFIRKMGHDSCVLPLL